MLLAGQWSAGSAPAALNSPFDGELLAEVQEAGLETVETALRDAAQAARLLRDMSLHERAAILRRTAGLLEEQREELARTIVLAAGCPAVVKPAPQAPISALKLGEQQDLADAQSG